MTKINYIYWKMWLKGIAFTALILYLLNWILRLPAVVPIIGDENTWLPIVASVIVAIILAILGFYHQNRFSEGIRQDELKREREKARLQTELINKKRCYDDLKSIIDENLSILNIEPKLLSLLSEYNPIEADYLQASKFAGYKSEVESQLHKITAWSKEYNLQGDKCVNMYVKGVTQTVEAFSKALGGAVPYYNKRNGVFTQMANADAIYPVVKDADKMKISILRMVTNNKFQKEKERLIKVHESQKDNMCKLFSVLKMTSELLLGQLQREIRHRENRLNRI